jgi:hypothetical protein
MPPHDDYDSQSILAILDFKCCPKEYAVFIDFSNEFQGCTYHSESSFKVGIEKQYPSKRVVFQLYKQRIVYTADKHC